MNDFLRFVRNSGRSVGQMAVLMHFHYRGPCDVMACGELLQLSPAGAGQMIEQLVQQGLVQRSDTLDDRRVRLVHLTAAGQQVVVEIIEVQRGWLDRLLAALTDEQRVTATQTLSLLTAQAAHLEAP